jgi:hypothetical protein
VETDPNLHLKPMDATHLRAVVANGRLHGQRGIAGPHGMIFVCNRRPKQSHNPIAHDPNSNSAVCSEPLRTQAGIGPTAMPAAIGNTNPK